MGTITAAEFAPILRKAGVELEKDTTLLSSYPVFYCRGERASAYIGYVLQGNGGSEFAVVLDDAGRVAFQERGGAGPYAGNYFADWDGNGAFEFVWRTDLAAVLRTRVIEVSPGAPCLLEIVRPFGFYSNSYTWDEGGSGILTYKGAGSGAQVTFTLQRNPFRLSVRDPSGALKEGWTISGPWARQPRRVQVRRPSEPGLLPPPKTSSDADGVCLPKTSSGAVGPAERGLTNERR